MLHVVAGIVLAQPVQLVQQAPIRQHYFETQHQFTHHSITQYGGAASVGGKVAADLASAFAAERQREQALRFACSGTGSG